MANWNTRLLNRVLSPYNTRQRYKYQLYDYLKENEYRQKSLERLLEDSDKQIG